MTLTSRVIGRLAPDYIGNMLDGKAAACRGAIRSGEDHLARLKRAADILDDVDYQVDKRADANQYGYGMAEQMQSFGAYTRRGSGAHDRHLHRAP